MSEVSCFFLRPSLPNDMARGVSVLTSYHVDVPYPSETGHKQGHASRIRTYLLY